LFRRQAWIEIRRFLLGLNKPAATHYWGNPQKHPETFHGFLTEI